MTKEEVQQAFIDGKIIMLTWDVSEQIDIKGLQKALVKINEPATVTEVDTQSDLYAIMVHSANMTLPTHYEKTLHIYWDLEEKGLI